MFMVKAHAGVRRFVFADGNSRRGAARGFGPGWRLRAVGARAPILVEARVNARCPLDVPDQMASDRRFRIRDVVDDVTRDCLAATPDMSIGAD